MASLAEQLHLWVANPYPLLLGLCYLHVCVYVPVCRVGDFLYVQPETFDAAESESEEEEEQEEESEDEDKENKVGQDNKAHVST